LKFVGPGGAEPLRTWGRPAISNRVDRMLGLLRCIGAFVLTAALSAALGTAHAQGSVQRGLYIANAAGCVGCHTDNKPGATPFAGGRPLDTPFGTFYGPNITPHAQSGIGRWTEADLFRALRMGERPDGTHYFPAFPYTSFAKMSDGDVRDLWAYLRSLPPHPAANRPHELRFPYRYRILLKPWKWLFFTPGPFVADTRASPAVNRGEYLVRVLGHCGECHTPRNFLGGLNNERLLAGAKMVEGRSPNLTPTRLKKWSDADLRKFLQTGINPGGDVAVDSMSEVVINTTSKLTPDDLSAMIAYLRTLPSVEDPK
jgi:mono/diheme cytochrome c family protein